MLKKRMKSFVKTLAVILIALSCAGCSDIFATVPGEGETEVTATTNSAIKATTTVSPIQPKPLSSTSEQALQSRNKLSQHSIKFIGKLNGISEKELINYFKKAYKPEIKPEDKINCKVDTKSIKRINIKNPSKNKNDLIVSATVWAGDENQITPSARDLVFILINDNPKAEKLSELNSIYDDKSPYSVVNLNDISGFASTLDYGGIADFDGDGMDEMIVTSDIKSSNKDTFAPIKILKYSKNKFIEIMSHEYEVTVKNKMYQFSSKYEIVDNLIDAQKKDLILSYTETLYKPNFEKDKEIRDKITFTYKNGIMIPDKIKEFPTIAGDYKIVFGKYKSNDEFVK